MDYEDWSTRVAMRAVCPDREYRWRIENERNFEVVAQALMLDVARTNQLRTMSEQSRIDNIATNINGISQDEVETAAAEEVWRYQNERNLEALA